MKKYLDILTKRRERKEEGRKIKFTGVQPPRYCVYASHNQEDHDKTLSNIVWMWDDDLQTV